ncbi:MAG: N-acetyltransferase, partial [Chloroflexota bacterium]|nr:N-acetyltransferase [Chloroflexota bacterium]
MAVTDNAFQPPAELRTDEFLLRPIRATDAEADYAAVMESREFLRPWEQSGWPEDDFTVDANRQDLAKLERRHADGESFTYTVLDAAGSQCLGCVYLFPTSAPMYARPQIAATGGEAWSAYELAIYFWVRTSRLADGLDQRLLAALGPWLAQEWGVE